MIFNNVYFRFICYTKNLVVGKGETDFLQIPDNETPRLSKNKEKTKHWRSVCFGCKLVNSQSLYLCSNHTEYLFYLQIMYVPLKRSNVYFPGWEFWTTDHVIHVHNHVTRRQILFAARTAKLTVCNISETVYPTEGRKALYWLASARQEYTKRKKTVHIMPLIPE